MRGFTALSWAAASLAAVGVEGNERLTAATGAVLIVLLAALGVTILDIGPLVWWHVLLGMLLIPPVLLKLGSTGWRFYRYYTGKPEYVRRGPPVLGLRLLAPIVVAATIGVFATGVALLVVGPGSHGVVVLLHKASFVIWLGATAIHVLAHLGKVPRAASRVPGAHRFLLAAAIVAGAIVAVATIQYAHPWVDWMASHRHFGDG